MTSRRRLALITVSVFVAYFVMSGPVSAQTVIDTVMTDYSTAAAVWVTPLKNYAIDLFWGLATIQFCFAMGQLALRGADLSELLAELVTQFFFIGIFFFLVQQSNTLANDIISSFKQAATSASGTAGADPTGILNTGINMAQKICNLMGITTPGIDIFYAIAAFVVILLMAYIAALAVMVNVEAYIIVSALVLFTGFGGSRWTKEYALRSLTYAIAIGGKLFMLNLVVGIGEQILSNRSATFTGTTYSEVMSLVGVILVLAAVVKQLPDMTASLLSGAAIGASTGLIGAGKTAATAAVTGATAGAGMAVAGVASGALASQQVAAGAGASGASRLARFASFTGHAARNFGDAALSDLGGRLAGTRTNRGYMGFRMAADLNNRTQSQRAAPAPTTQQKPPASPPAASPQQPPSNTIS
ncbi:P-type conjugative transfer protein TrbL [Acidisoma cladoniae]|jgi:type IV secretion system protein TrbL|uniref:P-type conjugative transfer protein TrbL n=1 Tax=Acidisoma cladoniae TaxID=3040935 RepID=UPI00254C21F8|nr:P-type conjugative transfer protein TrbL [Acidisoma sp. PAMC 29798]